MTTSWQALDDLDHLVPAVTLGAAVLDEVSHPFDHGALLGSSGHGDPPPTLEVKQAFVAEDVQSPQHGVLVDAEDRCHVFGQWQPLARTCLAFGNGPTDLRRDL